MKKVTQHPIFIKLTHWEYWNSKFIYAPIYPYWLWLSIKARSFFFLTAANPGIKNGGYIMERKKDIYTKMPSHLYPKTNYHEPGDTLDHVLQQMHHSNILFPVIAKPDFGERGLAVKKIYNADQLAAYVARMPVPYLVQEFIDYPFEVGIFYWRMPDSKVGHISGIVNKEPVQVMGDGVHTVAQLVAQNNRYVLYRTQLATQNPTTWNTVPSKGATYNLMPYGNHCRGSKFTHEKNRTTPKLSATLNRICLQIPGFYYGRLDIKFSNWDDLENGRHFSIIEVNGSGSEPTHIYDPANSLFFAWKEITKHWTIMYQISKANNVNGTPYLTLSESREQIKQFKEIEALLTKYVW